MEAVGQCQSSTHFPDFRTSHIAIAAAVYIRMDNSHTRVDIMMITTDTQIFSQAEDLFNWAFRAGVLALIIYVWRNEARQYKQDIEARELETRIKDSMTNVREFRELQVTVHKIDRLIVRIADKMNIPTKEYD